MSPASSSRPRQPLWQLSLTTTPKAEEVLSDWLSLRFGQLATSYLDLETGLVTISLFLQRRPPWSSSFRDALRQEIRSLADFGSAPFRLSLVKLRRQDWAESWKRHFRPLEVGSALLVKPSWHRRRPRPRQAMIILDPGLSFGTGQHPTTGFCLQQVVAHRPKGSPKSFLDLGTGSGILAIAAAKLGYAPVSALDFDPDAVRIARMNARKNRVADRIDFQHQDVLRLSRRAKQQYSLVCANLTADLLLKNRDRIVPQTAPGGHLVLAGILRTEFESVRKHYTSPRLRLLRTRKQGEWESAAFEALPRT